VIPIRRTIHGGVWARLDDSGSWHLSTDDGTLTNYAVKKGDGLNEWDLLRFDSSEVLQTYDDFLSAAQAGNGRHNEDVREFRKAQEAASFDSFKGDYDD